MRTWPDAWVLGFVGLACSACSAGADTSDVVAASAPLSGVGRAPTPPVGDFRSAGTVEAIGRLTVDVIDTRMPDAQEQLSALQADGATCQTEPADTWRCSKVHPAAEVPATSLSKIGAQNHGLYATFQAPSGDPVLTSQGDSLVEWAIPQSGESSAGAFGGYRYLELEGDVTKLILPGDRGDSSLELILRDADHLAKWDSTTVTESRWRFHQDMAFVVLGHD